MDKIYLFIFIALVVCFLCISKNSINIEGFQVSPQLDALKNANLGDCSIKFIVENGINLIRKIDNIERTLKENNKFIDVMKKEYDERKRNQVIMQNLGKDKAELMVDKQKNNLAKSMGVSREEIDKLVENPKLPNDKQAKNSSIRNLKSLL